MVTGINVLSHIIDGFTHVDPSLLYYFGLIMHFGKIQLRSCRQVQQACTPAVKVPEAVPLMDDCVQVQARRSSTRVQMDFQICHNSRHILIVIHFFHLLSLVQPLLSSS